MLTFLEYRVALGLIHLHHNILNGLVLLLHLTIKQFSGTNLRSCSLILGLRRNRSGTGLSFLRETPLSGNTRAFCTAAAESRGQKFLGEVA